MNLEEEGPAGVEHSERSSYENNTETNLRADAVADPADAFVRLCANAETGRIG